MAKASNMSAPVTRGEFEPAVAKLATKAELEAAVAKLATKAELEAAVAKLATKAELEAAIAPLATKAELAQAIAPLATKAEIAQLATKAELELWGGALIARFEESQKELRRDLQTDLARHVNAFQEFTVTMLRAIDDKYTDLPGRVSRLESAVFTPTSR